AFRLLRRWILGRKREPSWCARLHGYGGVVETDWCPLGARPESKPARRGIRGLSARVGSSRRWAWASQFSAVRLSSEGFSSPIAQRRNRKSRQNVFRTSRYLTMAAATAVALAACGRDDADRTSTSDSALSRDLTLASTVDAPTPQLQDTADSTMVEKPEP